MTEEDKLIQAALEAMANAYAPYSGIKVGAAVLAQGKIFKGCNVENTSYGLSMCAERNAVAQAVVNGCPGIKAVALVSSKDIIITPCGACRQVLAEFNEKARVLICDSRGKVLKETSVKDLLPDAFKLNPR